MRHTKTLRGLRLSVVSLALALFTCSTGNTCGAAEPSPARVTRIVKAIQATQPAVVNIEGIKEIAQASKAGMTERVNGMGAGVIIDSSGYILTNQHVIADVARIEVTLHDGRKFYARLIAHDDETDVALIKINPDEPLPEIPLGTSADLMLGEPVIAIGNPFGYHHTVTEGIISALHRTIPVNGVKNYPDLIQTDASINPGNSGGPLLNADGLMIGLNVAVRIGAQGIGFAIPVDNAIEVAAEMIADLRRGRGHDALIVKPTYRDGRTFVEVARSSVDEVEAGDVIHTIEGRAIRNRLDYELALLNARQRPTVEMEVYRGDTLVSTRLPLNSTGPEVARWASTQASPQQVMKALGLTLEPVAPQVVKRVDASYQGGMRITAVTPGSPAARAQLRPGDILVGLLEWQTPNWKDIEWIVGSPEWAKASAPKFHIIRGHEVFWGTLVQ